jgi:hypothetical protein
MQRASENLDETTRIRDLPSPCRYCSRWLSYVSKHLHFFVQYLTCANSYYDEIRNPMDFGTMSNKLNASQYQTMEEFKDDVELVLSNCRLFNPPGTGPTICAGTVEKVFRKEWPKAMERKLSWTEKRGLQGVMSAIVKEQMYVWVPVLLVHLS